MDGSIPSGYADALAQLDRRIEREILRLRARYQLSLDEFRGLYVSDEQVDSLVASATAAPEHPASKPDGFIASSLQVGARWRQVVAGYALTGIEQDLLLLALAPELDLKYESLYAYLNNDVSRKWPTLELARRLLGTNASARAVAAALAPDATLRKRGLIEAIEPPAARPTQLNAGFALRPCVSRFLAGVRLTPSCATDSIRAPSAQWGKLPFASNLVERLQGIARLLTLQDDGHPAIVLVGDPGSGRQLAAAAIARALDLPLRVVDFGDLRRAGASARATLSSLAVELRLEPAALCLSGIDALCDRDGHLQTDAQELLRELDENDTPLIMIVSRSSPWRGTLGRRRVLTIEFEAPDYDQRLHLWQEYLHAASIHIARDECAALADRFRLGPTQIRDAVRATQDWARSQSASPIIEPQRLFAEARLQSNMRANGLVSKVNPVGNWEDLILPPNARQRLRELSAAIKRRHVVYAEWGFAQRVACGTGIKALFAGASGTGKTMAAGVIARELGLDMYKIDLSGVISKYIGETEKNLDRIFEAARSANAVLFFDEADAIFGKRSEVKDAHDRYANVEVAYLLQKLEEHDGVVILASNLKRNIDEAFARRLHYVIDFPKPDATQREQLWRGMFPSTAPLAADINFEFLARQFELAGGDIRNVVLDAAFLAAQDSGCIGMPHLVQALARQMGKQGKAATLADFQSYFALLRSAEDVHATSP